MKASELILDLLRTYGSRGTSVQQIAEAGALFEVSANSIRVNLSRLVNKGAIELIQRGHYRICANATSVNEFAESWRKGEARIKPWDNSSWTCIHLIKSDERSKWVLTNHGFKLIDPGLWSRPANLSIESPELIERLRRLGLSSRAILLDNAQLLPEHHHAWLNQIDIQQIQQRYQTSIQQLHESEQRLAQLPNAVARKESFTLGGEAIEILAKDPLLPEQLMNPQPRIDLWQAMLSYDKAGKEVWRDQTQQTPDVLVTPNSKLMNTQVSP